MLGATGFSGDLGTFAEMGFLEELQWPILASCGSWRRVQEWLTGSEAAASLGHELRTSAHSLHSPEDGNQNQAARARPWGQVAFRAWETTHLA